MSLRVFEIIYNLDPEYRNIWIKQLLLDNYYIQRLQLELMNDKTYNVDRAKLKKMLEHYNVEEPNIKKALANLPIKYGETVVNLSGGETIKEFSFLLRQLSRTRSNAKIYKLLFDYFKRVNDPVNRKWSIEILLNSHKARELVVCA